MVNRMNKLVVAMIKVAAIYGLTSLSSVVNAETGGKEKGGATINWDGIKNVKSIPSVPSKETAVKAVPGGAQGVYQLEEGRTVPAQRLDGSPAKKAATGAVIYGRGVYVERNGTVRSGGKVVRKLEPGESLSMDELEGYSRKAPDSPNRSAGSASSTPPVGRSDIPGSPTGYPAAPNEAGPANVGLGNPSGAGGATISPGAIGSPDRATRAESRSGQDVFVLGNGTQVPADLGDGVTGKPNDAGGVDYSDGRSSHVDPATGDTVFSNPDGSEASRYTPATEGMGTTPDGKATETFVMPNGNHVPREQGGGTGVPNDRGGVSYPDGSYTQYDSASGETVFFDNTGNEIDRSGSQQAFPSTTDDGGSVFVITNGQTVPRTGPEGQVGTPNANGGVDYEGGLSINPTGDGRTVVTGSPNGNYIAVESSTDASGNATFDLGNGTSVPANSPAGDGRIVEGGAGVEYSDGTFVSVDAKTGETVIQYPGGSSEVLYGEHNKKDAANYVYTTSGESSSGSSSDNSSGTKKDSSDSSGSTGKKDTSSDDDKDSKSKDDDKDSSDKGSDDKGDDKGSKDDGKGSDDKEGADKNIAADGDAGNAPAGKKTVDDALARKTGEKKQPDSTAPPGCDEGRGGPPGGVAEPGAGRQDCVPGSLQPKGEDDDDAEPAPVLNAPIGNSFKRDAIKPEDRVGQPGVGIDRNSNNGRTLDNKLQDIEGVVNPGDR